MERFAFLLAAIVLTESTLSAREFDIIEFGATANDETDDTDAIEKGLAACGDAGGGTVLIPAGTFLLSRRNKKDVRIHGNTLKAPRRLLRKRTENLASDISDEDGPGTEP